MATPVLLHDNDTETTITETECKLQSANMKFLRGLRGSAIANIIRNEVVTE